jgi:EAL domain-containing protein (putative c-di-GMP-specific phosphodiesterase class I)
MGCELLQGYAIAKPMPANEFEQWLVYWQMPTEWKQAMMKQ